MNLTKDETAKPAAHNCTNPPHFPPHCGCPASVVPGDWRTALADVGVIGTGVGVR